MSAHGHITMVLDYTNSLMRCYFEVLPSDSAEPARVLICDTQITVEQWTDWLGELPVPPSLRGPLTKEFLERLKILECSE